MLYIVIYIYEIYICYKYNIYILYILLYIYEIHTAVLALQSLLATLALSSMNYKLTEINNFKKHKK